MLGRSVCRGRGRGGEEKEEDSGRGRGLGRAEPCLRTKEKWRKGDSCAPKRRRGHGKGKIMGQQEPALMN